MHVIYNNFIYMCTDGNDVTVVCRRVYRVHIIIFLYVCMSVCVYLVIRLGPKFVPIYILYIGKRFSTDFHLQPPCRRSLYIYIGRFHTPCVYEVKPTHIYIIYTHYTYYTYIY